MCEEFNCPPSVALKQPVALTFAVMELRAYARAYALVTDEDTDEEALTKLGVPSVLVDEVMANIEASRDHR